MEISKEDLEELKNIYKKVYGETLSDAEALEMGQRLVNLFRIIYRPLPSPPSELYDKDLSEI